MHSEGSVLFIGAQFLHSVERRILTAGWRDSAANVGESRESWEVVDATQNSGGCHCACQAG